MSGTSEIMVVDTKQASAKLSPETADSNANGSVKPLRTTGVIRPSGGAFQTSDTA